MKVRDSKSIHTSLESAMVEIRSLWSEIQRATDPRIGDMGLPLTSAGKTGATPTPDTPQGEIES